MHTGITFQLTFCRCDVNQFFCDVSQLFRMSCSDKYVHEFGAVVFSLCLFSICFMSILASYVQISLAVLRIPSEEVQHKASSTGLPHLTVVSLFSCMGSTAYMKPISTFAWALAPVIAVLYSVLPPVISPAIYSMKNKDIKGAMRKLIKRKLQRRKEVSLLFAWLRFSLLHAFIKNSMRALQETLNIFAEHYLRCSG